MNKESKRDKYFRLKIKLAGGERISKDDFGFVKVYQMCLKRRSRSGAQAHSSRSYRDNVFSGYNKQ